MARILIVEDEPGIALAVGDDLAMDGHQIEVASDGPSGARRAREGRFDLVLLDIMLPGKDGFDVCRELRRTGVMTPILMLTARAQESEKVMGFELGADDYLTKPFGVRELRARVTALLRRSQPPRTESVLRIGSTEVDFTRGEVRRGGETVTLTSLEFKLLDLFSRNRGRILSRDQLVTGAWGPNVFVSERVVDNHIGNLRKKIEPDPREPRYLRNLRGLGYRFDT
jgi:DNA-binding response OmpR family regulator